MIQIIDKRSTGKTGKLLLLAKETNSIVVCSNPKALKEKALYYGIAGLEFMSYKEFLNYQNPDNQRGRTEVKNFVVDELEMLIRNYNINLIGYTLTEGN